MPNVPKIPPPDDDVPLVYANFVRVQGGIIDVTVDFGRQSSGVPVSVDWSTRVTMTWEEAALLHKILGQHLERIQKRMGSEIRDLAEISKRVNATAAKPEEEGA